MNSARPRYGALSPSSDSIRSRRLYLATRSERHSEPVLICPAAVPTACRSRRFQPLVRRAVRFRRGSRRQEDGDRFVQLLQKVLATAVDACFDAYARFADLEGSSVIDPAFQHLPLSQQFAQVFTGPEGNA